MTTKQTLLEDLSEAMRERDAQRRDTLRMVLAAIKQEEVDSQRSLGEAEVQQVLMKQVKQRREAIADAERANRDDLVVAEQEELAIIEGYLPPMMTRDEIRELAEAVIAETGASGMQSMGTVMGKLMPQVQGRADGREVSDVVRDLLR